MNKSSYVPYYILTLDNRKSSAVRQKISQLINFVTWEKNSNIIYNITCQEWLACINKLKTSKRNFSS